MDTFATIHLMTTAPVAWVWENRYDLAAAPGWVSIAGSWRSV